MKTPLYSIFFFSVLAVSCKFSPIPEVYRVQFPQSPASRTELLGISHWRLEYYDSGGNFRQKEIHNSSIGTVEISILQEWPNAVLAWPYWPEYSLPPGYFYPAGGLFPLDTGKNSIVLSWEAGAEAFFYRELENAQGFNTGTNRIPKYFDWKRFRSLLRNNTEPELTEDPWLADWKDIAERTVRSGFRQTYLRPENRISTEITIPHTGPWISASPFRPPEFWAENEEITLLLSSRPEIFVCPAGRFSVSSALQMWMPFQP